MVLLRTLRILILLAQVNLSASFSWFNDLLPTASTEVKRPPSNVKILVLPGFGNDKIDYFLPGAPEGSIVESLKLRGWNEDQICVLPVDRSDWLQVFSRGALDLKFWRNEAPPTNPAFRWYLDLVSQEVDKLCNDDANEKSRVVLLGHSAGGWLARAALGYGSSDNDEQDDSPNYELNLSNVLGLVTLGSPHNPPPPEVMDMTRGALRLTHEAFPGDFHAPDLFYMTVIGEAVQGVKQEGQLPWEPTTLAGFAYNSYEAVCGDGTTNGDGVVPTCAGHLDGAQKIDLPGVLHSINAPSQWYGSDGIIDRWHAAMIDSIYVAEKEKSQSTENALSFFAPRV